jgi:hypothetical protein
VAKARDLAKQDLTLADDLAKRKAIRQRFRKSIVLTFLPILARLGQTLVYPKRLRASIADSPKDLREAKVQIQAY